MVSTPNLPCIFVRVSWCDFVDRIFDGEKRTIHEITRTDTNKKRQVIRVWGSVPFWLFSVLPLCSLCLGGELEMKT